jgi:hypothetical protein
MLPHLAKNNNSDSIQYTVYSIQYTGSGRWGEMEEIRILYQCLEMDGNLIKRIISRAQTATHNMEQGGKY